MVDKPLSNKAVIIAFNKTQTLKIMMEN